MLRWGSEATMTDKPGLMEQTLDRYNIRYNPTRSGWQSIHCPNQAGHAQGDRNPSCRLNMTHGLAKCNACELNGDAYNVIMLIEGIDFREAKARIGGVYVEAESDYLF